MSHPCLSCGACCATFRVSMHWSEADPALGGAVPAALTERLDAHQVCMRGTWEPAPRCVALDAVIGQYSRCTIHPQRPGACRQVQASWEHLERDLQLAQKLKIDAQTFRRALAEHLGIAETTG